MTSLDLHQLEQLSLRVSPVRKSPSADDLSAHSYPRAAVPVSSPTAASTGSRSSSSTTSSVMEEFSEELVEERLQHTSKQLQSEIELIVSQLTRIGQEMNCGNECSHLIADHDDTEHHKNMRIGRKKFNRTPKEGVKYLIDKGLLNHTVEDIGMFLFVGELLDKTAIGEYLGEWKEFNIKVLENFVQLHDFTGMNLVEALRYFLSSFMLPGEAQKIDRMMELFARQYCTCNPGVFCNPDACYVLSFSVIMLNTSLHNPNVKDKPSVEQFISMNRAINDGKDFPPEMLRRLFDNIKSEPFHVHEGADDLTHVFFNPDHAGWLTKEGGKHKSWRKRYFILSDNCLYYFKTPSEKEPRGIIPLENLAIKECHDVKKPFCFEISSLHDQIHSGQVIKACKTTGDGKVVTGNHEVYRIQAKSQEEMEEWMKRIRASISSNPFLEILQQRRQRVSQKGPVML